MNVNVSIDELSHSVRRPFSLTAEVSVKLIILQDHSMARCHELRSSHEISKCLMVGLVAEEVASEKARAVAVKAKKAVKVGRTERKEKAKAREEKT